MELKTNQIETIKGILSDNFWSGKRWLAIDTNKVFPEKDGITCFVYYQDAADFCTLNEEPLTSLRIFLLGGVLKLLYGRPAEALCQTDSNKLLDVISRYPIDIDFDQVYFGRFIDDCFFPVVWQLTVNLSTYIDSYHITMARNPGSQNETRLKGTELFMTTDSFATAIEEMQRITKDDDLKYDTAMLIGQFKCQSLVLDSNGAPIKQSGICLYTSKKTTKNTNCSFEQLNDPTSLFTIPVAMFARYKKETQQIYFYDGSLRKIRPGKQIGHVDLRYYRSVPELNLNTVNQKAKDHLTDYKNKSRHDEKPGTIGIESNCHLL